MCLHRCACLPRSAIRALDLHTASLAMRACHRARELDQQALVQVARAALNALAHLVSSPTLP